MDKAEKELLLKLSNAQFAMWELHVFLDTHPDNKEAYALKEKYEGKYSALLKEYEEKYSPLTINADMPNLWLKDPWPWDLTGGDD